MAKKELFLILGNQLFPPEALPLRPEKTVIYMAEDYGLCTYYRHHKHKILLFLVAMRHYRDELKKLGYEVYYKELSLKDKDSSKSYFDGLEEILKKTSSETLHSFEVEDKFFESDLCQASQKLSFRWQQHQSPMFLCSRSGFQDYLGGRKKPFMKTFYEAQRKNGNIMLEKSGEPWGGHWSYDADNRKKIPKGHVVPEPTGLESESPYLEPLKALVDTLFADHPGEVENFFWPVTRQQYLKRLEHFLEWQLPFFGDYQDAISEQTPFLYHSLLSPGLNLGLITPKEVVEESVAHYEKHKEKIPLSALEGFVRQIIGWREFVRGIYQNYSERQDKENFWNHTRQMQPSWYEGHTGIPPLDDAIRKVNDFAYSHHIERLMVLSNLMLLSEVHPQEVHRWFMEFHVDSSDWVMGPNVYGMGQFSDGGIFATKPYICGSNYLRKMSHYPNGDWCDVVDGLYWRFVHVHKGFFSKNPRMKMMMGALDRMDSSKKERLFTAAENFLEEHTY